LIFILIELLTFNGKTFVVNSTSIILKMKIMRRALFITVIAFAALSCNNSGSSGGTSDSSTTTTGTDTMNNMNNGTGTGTGTTTDTSTMTGTGTGTGTGTDTMGRTGGTGRNNTGSTRDSTRH
jgi:hypothetical protein